DLACTLNPGQSPALTAVPVAAANAGSRLSGQASAAAASPSATLWQVDPGGSFTAALTGTAALTDTATSAGLACKSAALAGTLKYGRNLPAAGIGSVTSFTLAKCKDRAGGSFT